MPVLDLLWARVEMQDYTGGIGRLHCSRFHLACPAHLSVGRSIPLGCAYGHVVRHRTNRIASQADNARRRPQIASWLEPGFLFEMMLSDGRGLCIPKRCLNPPASCASPRVWCSP